jgi:phosphate transport system permease protein
VTTAQAPVAAMPDDSELPDVPRRLGARSEPSDVGFRFALRGGGIAVLAIMTLIGVFLSYRALEALRVAKWSFLTTSKWEPDSHHFGIAAIIVGTILIAIVAILVAVPLATASALFISEYAPRKFKRTFVSLVDLMAAVPSVVYALWGFFFLQPVLLVHGEQGNGLPRFLATYLGWIPLFHVTGANPRDPLQTPTVYTSSTFIAGLVVSLMVAPIVCSIMREVFSQAPIGEREGALALGATKWGMIRAVVLPYGRGGMIGGTMLGLGRALGETIGVYLIISPVFAIQPHILQNGTNSVSALIALRYGEASPFAMSALMAAGLVLFLMTLVVNFGASSIVARSRSGSVS